MDIFIRLMNLLNYIFVNQDARYDLKVTVYLMSDMTTLLIIKLKLYITPV